MADRYWVGDGRGGGTWTAADTSVWSTAAPIEFTASLSGTTLTTPTSPPLIIGMKVFSNGGVSLGTITAGSGTTWTVSLTNTYASQTMYAFTYGASVPTSVDNVYFPKPVGRTISMSTSGALTCADLNILLSGITVGGTGSFTISGNVTTVSGVSLNYTGATTFSGSGSFTIQLGSGFNGALTFNNAVSTWTMNSALSTSSTLTVTAGSLITNNYALSTTALNSTGTSTRAISLGSSAVALTGTSPINIVSTGLTFNAGTSTITMAGPTISVVGGDQTFYNVNFSNTTTSTITIGGVNTFNNFTVTNYYTTGYKAITFSANQTINGILTLSGAGTALSRTSIFSSVIGTTRTLTVASFAAGSNDYDFRDISITGAAAPISGTRFGNCGGNTGITFPSSKTVYRVGSDTTWYGNASWATTSGGTGNNLNLPLAHDTAIINNSTIATAIGRVDPWPICTLDVSTRTTAFSLSLGTSPVVYGSWIGGSSTTISGTPVVTFSGQKTQTITSVGKSFPGGVTVNSPNGTIILNDALLSSGTFTHTSGTIDLSGFTLTTYLFSSIGSGRYMAFNGGNITVTGNGGSTFFNSGTVLLTGTPTVNITTTTNLAVGVAGGAGTDQSTFDFNFKAGTYTLTLSGNCGSVDFTGFSGSLGSGVRTYYGNLTLSTTMTINTGPTNTQTFAGSGGSRTITSNGKVFNYPLAIVSATDRTWVLQDAYSTGYAVTLTSGTLDLGGRSLTCASFTSSGTLDRNLTFNGGIVTITNSGLCATFNGSGFTSTAGSAPGQLSFINSNAKSMLGGGFSFACALNQGNSGTLSLNNGNYTFDDITASYRPTTISLPANYTITLNNFTLNGVAGSLVTLNSVTAGSRATLFKSSGTVAVNYLSIKDIAATGGATWTNNLGTNGGNNLGWIFTAIALLSNKNFFIFF